MTKFKSEIKKLSQDDRKESVKFASQLLANYFNGVIVKYEENHYL